MGERTRTRANKSRCIRVAAVLVATLTSAHLLTGCALTSSELKKDTWHYAQEDFNKTQVHTNRIVMEQLDSLWRELNATKNRLKVEVARIDKLHDQLV